MDSKRKRVLASIAPIKKGPLTDEQIMHIYAGSDGGESIEPIPPENLESALQKLGVKPDEKNKLRKSRKKALELMTEK